MIKVLEEKKVPRAQVKCDNCGSILEYGNADLSIDYEAERAIQSNYQSVLYSRLRCFICPVCGIKQSASWIHKLDT